MDFKKAKHMTHFAKAFIAAAFITSAATAPAIGQAPAAPDTSPECTAVNVTVYFAEQDATLSTSALAALEANATDTGGCKVSTIEATTVSSDGGANLSTARSDAVLIALADMGIATADTVTQIEDNIAQTGLSTQRTVELTLTTLPTLRDS